MSTLHTVNKSPYERNAELLDHASSGDCILLIEDGVLGTSARAGSFRQLAYRNEIELRRSMLGSRSRGARRDQRRSGRGS